MRDSGSILYHFIIKNAGGELNEGATIYLSKLTKSHSSISLCHQSKKKRYAYDTRRNSGFKPWCSQDIVSSPDTDAIVLLLHQRPYICRNEFLFLVDKQEHTLT